MAKHIEIVDKVQCCGCSACMAACPKQCIAMEYDGEGFKYPVIDESACIDCGKCVSVCPLTESNRRAGFQPVKRAFAVSNRDQSIRASSTSGGAFAALAKMVLDGGGIVVGARFDGEFHVIHDFAENSEGVSAFYGSKYVQSDLAEKDIYRKVHDACEQNVPVLFSGTPCQTHGLRTFLGRDYPGLYVCDFVCHAVPSPLVWEAYLHAKEASAGSKAVEVVFRNKTYGYHSGTMKIAFANGSVYYGSARVDPMHKAFFADVISRPSCYRCHFRTTERSSDFTIFDCWSYEQLTGREDDNLGHSHLWVHTEKGLQAIERFSPWLDMVPVDPNAAVAADGVMATRDIACNPLRDEFMAACLADGLESSVTSCFPVTGKDRLIEKCKGVLYRIGVLSVLSRAKRRRKHHG
ncbi:MAG: Coenzyme F420 hydrogenase/dehydrogenase, beta subunit C-terminal domain [Eggerthellaceae bacterium]|nr:Coenzyme F420 hydrogenase/dehydrogenase, beta subunit C-terminal domain [Eggerthellaceae bacterium]